MSTYWGYYCRTCSKESEHWHNHGEELLAEFYEAWRVVHALQPRWVSVRVGQPWDYCEWELGDFLKDHEGHDIALHSEYGDIADLPPRHAPNTSP